MPSDPATGTSTTPPTTSHHFEIADRLVGDRVEEAAGCDVAEAPAEADLVTRLKTPS